MLALLQRVLHAKVEVSGQTIGAIDNGLLVFLAIEPNDDETTADRLVQRMLGYRIFSDANDKMNLSVQDVNGGVLIVSQFTLAADTKSGMRPSFTSAAPPELGERLYDYFVMCAKEKHPKIATGEFGADMQVSLCNDGPVTIIL